MNKFSISEAIKFGWNTTKANFSFFLKLLVIVGLIYLISGAISEGAERQDRVTGALIGVVMWIIQLVISMGVIKIALKFTDNQKGEISDLYSQYPLFLKFLFASILNGLVMFIGMIPLLIYMLFIYRATTSFGPTTSQDVTLPPLALLPILALIMIIPIIIFGVRLQFFSYFIIDQGSGPIEALKKSWTATRGQYWRLILFYLATMGLNILGAFALLVGLLWTIPTTSIATASVYRKLSTTS